MIHVILSFLAAFFMFGIALMPCSLAAVDGRNDISLRFNEFAFKMIKVMSENPLKEASNFIFSPYSISTAFAMLAAGAREGTKREMVAGFGWGNYELMLVESMAPLIERFSRNKENGSRFSIANKIWVDHRVKVLETYRKKVNRVFNVTIGREPFRKQPEESRVKLNKWVAERTGYKIENLFPLGSIGANIKLTLANAIYFKGNWQQSFDTRNTKEDKFFSSKLEYQTISFMTVVGNYATHLDRTLKVRLLELPYSGGRFSMLMAKPLTFDIDVVEKGINSSVFNDWMKVLKKAKRAGNLERLKISIPKFTVKAQVANLDRYLRKIKINALFSPTRADLSGINGGRDLYCTSAIHKAFLQVDERGTTAAAATGLMTRMLPSKLVIDRPFLIFLVDKTTNIIMFYGKVVNLKHENGTRDENSEMHLRNVTPKFENATRDETMATVSRSNAKSFVINYVVIVFTSSIALLVTNQWIVLG